MPNKRTTILLAVAVALPLWALAQDPAPDTPQAPAPQAKTAKDVPPTAAETTLDEAIKKLQALDTFGADIRLSAEMLGQGFRVVGQYDRSAGNKLFLSLSVEGLGNVTGTLQQVSDGTTLWEYSKILENQSLRTMKLEPVLAALKRPDTDAEFRDRLMAQFGFAGPDALLAGLRKAAHFDQMAEEEFESRPVWIIRGIWKDREALGLPGGQNAPERGGFLPLYVPSVITIWLDRETGWPHKVFMQGKLPPNMQRDDLQIDSTGRAIGRKSTLRRERPSELTLTYTRSDREILPEHFLYEPPPDVQVFDDTDRRTADIEAAIAELAQRRRNQANAQGELIDQPITAPAPNPGEAPAPEPSKAPSPESFRSSAPAPRSP